MSPFKANKRLTKSVYHGGPKNMKGAYQDMRAMRRIHRFYHYHRW